MLSHSHTNTTINTIQTYIPGTYVPIHISLFTNPRLTIILNFFFDCSSSNYFTLFCKSILIGALCYFTVSRPIKYFSTFYYNLNFVLFQNVVALTFSDKIWSHNSCVQFCTGILSSVLVRRNTCCNIILVSNFAQLLPSG